MENNAIVFLACASMANGGTLSYSDLRGSDLRGSNLSYSNLRGARGLSKFIIAGQGGLIGWKKLNGGQIAKLEIPAEALRVNAYGSRKCRAEFVRVLELDEPTTDTRSGTITYRVGEVVRPDSYDPDPRVECSHGIHFFITREEAEDF